jgi:perosamine synthetase
MISVSEPILGAEEERLVVEVLRSGRLVQGPMVERFEEDVRAIVGTRHSVAVNNGTSALIAALLANGIGPGDQVITSPFTFVATLNSILHVGATPRFVDVGDDFNLDPELLFQAIDPATRAIVPVHLYGQAADMERVLAAVAGWNVVTIEDAAQALGALVAGRSVGSFGTGCFSFYATKNITTGEGGVVTTDDDGAAASLRVLRNQGQRGRYDYERPGFNFRMTELQAALGVAQMARLPGIIEARRSNARALTDLLAGTRGLLLPQEAPGRQHVFHQYTVRVTPEARLDRDGLVRHLRGREIDVGVYYPRPVYDYDCFRRDPRVGSPVTPRAERIAREVLSLPVHPRLDDSDIKRIAEAVREGLAS